MDANTATICAVNPATSNQTAADDPDRLERDRREAERAEARAAIKAEAQRHAEEAARKQREATQDDDVLLRGAKAIADDLGIPLRAAYHGLETGTIPASKQGVIWVSTRARVRAPYYA
jgi:hypothetical protein